MSIRVRLTAAALVMCVTSASVRADDTRGPEEQARRATRKIWLGAGLMAVGAVITPITGERGRRTDREVIVTTGVGTMAVGSVMLWLGVRDRRKTLQPSTRLQLQVGRRSMVQVQRTW
jgi:hypothetical protein